MLPDRSSSRGARRRRASRRTRLSAPWASWFETHRIAMLLTMRIHASSRGCSFLTRQTANASPPGIWGAGHRPCSACPLGQAEGGGAPRGATLQVARRCGRAAASGVAARLAALHRGISRPRAALANPSQAGLSRPASSSHTGRSARRAEPRGRPGAGLRNPPAGTAPCAIRRTSPEDAPRAQGLV